METSNQNQPQILQTVIVVGKQKNVGVKNYKLKQKLTNNASLPSGDDGRQ